MSVSTYELYAATLIKILVIISFNSHLSSFQDFCCMLGLGAVAEEKGLHFILT